MVQGTEGSVGLQPKWQNTKELLSLSMLLALRYKKQYYFRFTIRTARVMISQFIDKWIEAQRNADFSQCAESCPQPSLEQPSFFCMCVLCPGSSSSVRSRLWCLRPHSTLVVSLWAQCGSPVEKVPWKGVLKDERLWVDKWVGVGGAPTCAGPWAPLSSPPRTEIKGGYQGWGNCFTLFSHITSL